MARPKNPEKAKLRLDIEAEAISERDGIRAIVPGNLDESELWHRILSDDPEEMMPPPESKKPMTKEEVSLFKAWIDGEQNGKSTGPSRN